MTPYNTILGRRDSLAKYLASFEGMPVYTYIVFFSEVLKKIPPGERPTRESMREVFSIVKCMIYTKGTPSDGYMVRQAYRNIRKAFYILLFVPVDKLPVHLTSPSLFDPVPYLVRWRLREGT